VVGLRVPGLVWEVLDTLLGETRLDTPGTFLSQMTSVKPVPFIILFAVEDDPSRFETTVQPFASFVREGLQSTIFKDDSAIRRS
jgi:hypothetical protein